MIATRPMIGLTVVVLSGKHKERKAIIKKYCNKRIKVAILLPGPQVPKEDIVLKPEALGLGAWYPGGTLATTETALTTHQVENVATAEKRETGEPRANSCTDHRSIATEETNGMELWQTDATIREHLDAITHQLQQLGLGQGTEVSLTIQTKVRTADQRDLPNHT